jgi:hypothetical protein
MSFKESLENNAVWYASGIAITAFMRSASFTTDLSPLRHCRHLSPFGIVSLKAARSRSEPKLGHRTAKKARKGRSHRRLVAELAFPNNEHPPAGSPQDRDMLDVTSYVSIQLRPPIRLT